MWHDRQPSWVTLLVHADPCFQYVLQWLLDNMLPLSIAVQLVNVAMPLAAIATDADSDFPLRLRYCREHQLGRMTCYCLDCAQKQS